MQEFERLLPRPDRDEIPESERAGFDAVVERTQRLAYERYGTPAQYFDALLNSPPLAAALVRLGTLVRQGQVRGTYSDAHRELIDIVYSKDYGYNSFLTVHLPDAFAVGVRPAAIEAIWSGREEELTEDEAMIVAYCRQVARGEVTDEAFAALSQRFGKRWVVEYTMCCAFIFMTLRLWQALGVPDPSDADVAQLLRELLDGSADVPDPMARIG